MSAEIILSFSRNVNPLVLSSTRQKLKIVARNIHNENLTDCVVLAKKRVWGR